MKRIINWFRLGEGIINKNVVGDGIAGVEPVFYDLEWTGTGAANQTFADAQVLNTAAEGLPREKGSITVTETGTGSVKLVSEKFEITGSGTWDETGLRETDGITKVLGKAFFGKLTHNTLAASLLGVNNTTGIVRANGIEFEFDVSDNLTITNDDASSTHAVVGTVVDATEYSLLVLQGGFSASAIPFYTGQAAADHKRGFHYFIKGGTFTNWTRAWISPTNNTATLYPYAQVLEASAVNSDDWLVPTNILNIDTMYQPLFLDTFNTGSGSLDARQSDIDVDSSGNGWTQRVADADWRIDTNTAELGVAGSDPGNNAKHRYIYVDVNVSDFIYEVDMKYDSGATGRNGVIFRGSAETGNGQNQWVYRMSGDSGDEELFEVEDGSFTSRDSAAHGAVNQTVYKLTVIANGTTIRCYRDGALKLEYTSASFNETETRMGLRADSQTLTDKAFDNVVIFPTTDSDWDAEISAKTGGTY